MRYPLPEGAAGGSAALSGYDEHGELARIHICLRKQADGLENVVFVVVRKRTSQLLRRDEHSLQYVFVHARRPIPATPWHVGLCSFSADFERQWYWCDPRLAFTPQRRTNININSAPWWLRRLSAREGRIEVRSGAFVPNGLSPRASGTPRSTASTTTLSCNSGIRRAPAWALDCSRRVDDGGRLLGYHKVACVPWTARLV